MHLASLAAMRTHAVTRHAAAAAICMPEGCRLLTQLLSPPLRQSIAVYACSLLELVVNDGALAGTVLREGKALGMLIQGVMTEASQASLRNTASSISAALEPASVAETGITELLESIRTLGEKEFVNDDAVGLVTALRLLQGFAAAQPDTGAAIVSSLGIHVLVGILNTVADALTLNEVYLLLFLPHGLIANGLTSCVHRMIALPCPGINKRELISSLRSRRCRFSKQFYRV